jgi:hypothetical protein
MPNDHPNSGILFHNDRKRPGDLRDRDYDGSARLDCPHCGEAFEVWLSGWRKEGKRGPFLSLSLKPKDANRQPALPAANADADADIPF